MNEITTEADFDTAINQPFVVMAFYATWCDPCSIMKPILHALVDEYKDQFDFFKVNVDELTGVADRFRVRGVPTLMIFKNGVEVATKVGVHPKDVISSKINEALIK